MLFLIQKICVDLLQWWMHYFTSVPSETSANNSILLHHALNSLPPSPSHCQGCSWWARWPSDPHTASCHSLFYNCSKAFHFCYFQRKWMSNNNGGKGVKAHSCFHHWMFWLQGGLSLYYEERMMCYSKISKQEKAKEFKFFVSMFTDTGDYLSHWSSGLKNWLTKSTFDWGFKLWIGIKGRLVFSEV